MLRQPHLRHLAAGLIRRQHTVETTPPGRRTWTAPDATWRWPPRLVPARWPGTDDLVLIVALTRQAGNEDPTTVATMPELFKFGLWDSDHVAIPRPPEVAVRRDAASLHLTILQRSWGGCREPYGTKWATTNSCLVGVTEGIAHLGGQRAAEAFLGRLLTQRAVIAAAKVMATPLAIHMCRVRRSVDGTPTRIHKGHLEEGAP